MLTPAFEITQNNEYIMLLIKAPYVKANDVEIYIEGNEFKLYVKPYFLRLYFPCEVIEDGKETAQYDISKGIFNINIPKKNVGEFFPNLDMLTTLLATKKSSTKKPLIEVVNDIKDNEETTMNEDENDDKEEEEEEEDWEIEQEIYETQEECLTGYKYGFANQSSGVFTRLQDELYDVIDITDPDNTSPQDRKTLRMKAEDDKFDKDHYIADYFDDEMINEIIKYEAPWEKEHQRILNSYKTSSYPETSNIITPKGNTRIFSEETQITFSEEEKHRLLLLPNKEYILSKEEEHVTFVGLVDIIFAYAYNHRTTEGDSTSESAWTLSKISPTLSWFDSFRNVQDVMTSSMRRCLCFPLYRNWHLINAVVKDVQTIFLLGKRWLLRCLLETYNILQGDESRYILNDLYLTDYTVWIQKTKSNKILSLANKLQCIQINKSQLGFNLMKIEDEASSMLGSRNIDTDSGSESDSSESSETGASSDTECSSIDSDDDVIDNKANKPVTDINAPLTGVLNYTEPKNHSKIEVISSSSTLSQNDAVEANCTATDSTSCNDYDVEMISTGLEELLSIHEFVKGSEDIE